MAARPITFDVGGYVDPARTAAATSMLTRLRPDLSRLDVLRAVGGSVARSELVLCAQGLGWSDAEAMRREAATVFRLVEVAEHAIDPPVPARMQSCEIHRVLYTGLRGCPVCRGAHSP